MKFDFIAHFLFCLLSTLPCNVKQSTTLPVRLGSSGGFHVTIGFGSRDLREHHQTLLVDSGSDLTWIQCNPCFHCYPQNEPIFVSSLSKTYAPIKFYTFECQYLLPAATGFSPTEGKKDKCIYTAKYGDGSLSKGNLAEDIVSLPGGREKTIVFGCGRNNKGVFRKEEAGILGLGREKLSFASQTSCNVFSYCLPSSSEEEGYLTFTPSNLPKSIRYTPMVGKRHYNIRIDRITVDGEDLGIPLTVITVDSGSFLTYLPLEVYAKLQESFMSKMSQYPRAPHLNVMDTCYNLMAYTDVDFPSVEFRFSGGVTVKIEPTGVVYAPKRSQVCLAFVGSEKDVIFGSYQHRTQLVVFDRLKNKIGFAPDGCK